MSDFKIDFCGVGAAKAGTTWVARCLMEHPQACIGDRKELNYFMRNHPLEGFVRRTGSHFDSLNYSRGIEWYAARYASCQPGRIKGELSTGYLADPDSPRLLYEHNPNLKLIMNYRNPADAVYSVYYQLNEAHPINESFEDLLKRSHDALNYYKYSIHTQRYLEVFPREQMHFIWLDDVKDKADEVWEGLCRYLGIDVVPVEAVHRQVNKSRRVRHRLIRNATLGVYILFDKNDTMRAMRDWMRAKGIAKAGHKIRKWNTVVEKYAPIKPETRAWLIDFFREDIEKLQDMHNRDLSHWLTMPETEAVAAK